MYILYINIYINNNYYIIYMIIKKLNVFHGLLLMIIIIRSHSDSLTLTGLPRRVDFGIDTLY